MVGGMAAVEARPARVVNLGAELERSVVGKVAVQRARSGGRKFVIALDDGWLVRYD